MSNLKKQGTSALIWDFLGKLLTQSAGFIVTLILARLLEPSDFGAIAMIMVVVGIAQVFSDVSLGSALIQRKKLLAIHYSSVFFFNISVSLLLSITLFISAQQIAKFYEYERLIPLLQVVSIIFITNALGSIQRVKLRKELNYRLITKVSFTASILSGLIGISLALLGFGVWSLIAQVILQSVFNTAFLWKASGWQPKIGFSFKALKQLWAFGFRMFLVSVLNAITERLDYLVIGKLFSTTELGFFQRAKSLNSLIIQYSSASLMSVLFPVLSTIQNDTIRFQNIVIKALNLLTLLVFLLVGGLYLSSEAMILVLYGEKWSASIPLLQGLLLSSFIYPINALLVNILSSRGNSKDFLKMALIKKTVFIANLFIAFQWGLMEYLYGLVLVGLINTSITIYFAAKEIELKQCQLHKPIFTQLLITVLSIGISLWSINQFDFNTFTEFLLSNLSFVLLFFTINFAIKTQSIEYFWVEFSPLLRKIIKF